MTTVSHPNAHNIIAGDSNIDLLKINDSDKSYVHEFLDTATENGFLPKITHPTRFTPHLGSSTLIDNFFVKSPLQIDSIVAAVDKRHISDHLGYMIQLVEPETFARPHPPKYGYINTQSPESLENLKDSLANINLMDSMDF